MFRRIPTSRCWLAGALLGLGAAALLASCDLGDEVVSPPVVMQVVITSHADTVLATVATQVQFAAVALDAHGASIPGAAIQWSSSEVNVAAIDATGRALALTAGITDIRAGSGAVQSAPVVLRVSLTPPAVASVEISGPSQVNVGNMASFSALARDAGGAVISGAAFTWSSSNPNVASVDATGTALGLTAGTTDIRATSESIMSPPATLTVVAPLSFATQIQPLLHPTCTAINCHGGSFPQQGLNLSPPGAYGELVNQLSTQNGALFLVEPGDPDNSYMYRKLLPCAFPNCAGARMPKDRAPLPMEQLSLIRTWIATGANP